MPLPPIDAPADLRALRAAFHEAELTGPATGPRIGIMASYTADPVVPYLGLALAGTLGRPEVHMAPYNQIVQECLDTNSGSARAELDVVVVAQRPEELEDGAWTPGLLAAAEAAREAVARWDATLIAVLPAVPEADPDGVAGDCRPDGRAAEAAAAREAMRAALAGRPNVYLVDLEAVLRSLGTARSHHPALYQFAKVPYREEVYHHLGARIAHVLRLSTGDACRIAALDLRGLGDAEDVDGFGGVLRWLSVAGVKSYALGGRDAVPAWRELIASDQSVPARLTDWFFDDRDLDAQVHALAAEAGAGDRDVAVLQRRQDRLVATVRPVRGGPAEQVDLGPDCAAWPMRLAAAGVFDRLPVPGLTVRAAAAEAAAGPAGGLSLEDFVAGLGAEADFRPARAGDLGKIGDMLAATKDFTLGVPLPDPVAGRVTADGDRVLLIGSVRDRLGDLGPSVVVALAKQDSDCVVEAFCVSCPAMGKGIETLAMREIAARARAMGADRIVVGYRETGRNRAAIDFLRSPAADAAAEAPDGAILDLVVHAETADREA